MFAAAVFVPTQMKPMLVLSAVAFVSVLIIEVILPVSEGGSLLTLEPVIFCILAILSCRTVLVRMRHARAEYHYALSVQKAANEWVRLRKEQHEANLNASKAEVAKDARYEADDPHTRTDDMGV